MSIKISTPAVIVNFKSYSEAEGKNALFIAEICEDVSKNTGVCISVCPPIVELSMIADRVNIPVLSQHADPLDAGAQTGRITPSSIKAAGGAGTLLNHSERRMILSDLAKAISICNEISLQSVACADSAETAGAIAFFRPDFIAVEPPQLIGGNVSVTTAKPDVVTKAVESVRKVDEQIPVFCGAGVKTGKDVKRAIELGADGVLLASGIIKSKDIRRTLEDLLKYI
ncbi:MAG: triose-phosphate isomerase [Methanomassiliicoccales archaeon]